MSARVHAFMMPREGDVISPVMRDCFALLRGSGCDVTWSIPDHVAVRPADLTPAHDLLLLKSQAPAALSLAAVLHAQGAEILNPYPACAAAQDKVVAIHRLATFGVPVPDTWASAAPAQLAGALPDGALVAKPFDGYHGTGVRFLERSAELTEIPSGDRMCMVQPRLAGADDLKVYVIGDDVFGVRKQFDPDSHGRAGRPVTLSDEVVEVARQCGAAFGFGLYGVDLVETDDGPVVVDVNHFPGYKGVPDAAERLASYVLHHLESPSDLSLPPLPRATAAVGR